MVDLMAEGTGVEPVTGWLPCLGLANLPLTVRATLHLFPRGLAATPIVAVFIHTIRCQLAH